MLFPLLHACLRGCLGNQFGFPLHRLATARRRLWEYALAFSIPKERSLGRVVEHLVRQVVTHPSVCLGSGRADVWLCESCATRCFVSDSWTGERLILLATRVWLHICMLSVGPSESLSMSSHQVTSRPWRRWMASKLMTGLAEELRL